MDAQLYVVPDRTSITTLISTSWPVIDVWCCVPADCPYRNDDTSRPDDPKAETDQGYGAGRVYWHGRLVPDTRIERVTWLHHRDAIRAINSLQKRTQEVRQMKKEDLDRDAQQTATRHNNVCSAMFMNHRARISTDKFYVSSASFTQSQLDIDVHDRTTAKDRETLIKEQLTQPFSDPTATKQLILSATKFKAPERSEAEPEHVGKESSLLDGVSNMYDWIHRASDFHDEISRIDAIGVRGDIACVAFLGVDYKVGAMVALRDCQHVREREMWVGYIRGLHVRDRTQPITRRRLEPAESIEVEIEWLPWAVSMPFLHCIPPVHT